MNKNINKNNILTFREKKKSESKTDYYFEQLKCYYNTKNLHNFFYNPYLNEHYELYKESDLFGPDIIYLVKKDDNNKNAEKIKVLEITDSRTIDPFYDYEGISNNTIENSKKKFEIDYSNLFLKTNKDLNIKKSIIFI